jgi:hypothetical protein
MDMPTLSKRHQLAIGITLFFLTAATRGYHFVEIQQTLPSASWAAYFLAGVYLQPVWVLPALLGWTGLLDYTAIAWGGVNDFCTSPAYAALIPAYASLWLAGRWYAARHRFQISTLVPLSVSVFVATVVCELISSGSFYFFSGRFGAPTFVEFVAREASYFPRSLAAIFFWIGAAAGIHAIGVAHTATRQQHSP